MDDADMTSEDEEEGEGDDVEDEMTDVWFHSPEPRPWTFLMWSWPITAPNITYSSSAVNCLAVRT